MSENTSDNKSESTSEKSSPAPALSSTIVIFDGGQLILPSNAVAEILPYAPSLGLEDAPPWIVGTILWQADQIPLVSLEALLFDDEPGQRQQYRRIVILNMLNKHPRLRYYGLLSTDTPQRVLLQRNELEAPREDTLVPNGILSHASLKGRQVMIPDLDVVEADLIKTVRRFSH